MRFIDNMRLRNKFLISFAGSGGILVLAMLFLLWQILNINSEVKTVAENSLPSIEQSNEISQLRLRYRVRSLEFMLADDAEEQAKLAKSMEELDDKLSAAFKKYQPLISSEDEKQVFQEAVKAANAYKASVQQVAALRTAGQEEEAVALSKDEWVKRANHLRDQTDNLAKINHDASTKAANAAFYSAHTAMTSGYVALAIALVLALVISTLMGRRISLRLNDTINAAKSIAQGNLCSSLPQRTEDEIGQLILSMDNMQQQLREAMLETRDNAQTLLRSSQDLHQSMQDMENAVSLQGEDASGIAANTEELTVSISHVADSTRSAAALTRTSDEQAAQGYDTLQTLVQRIHAVAEVVSAAAGRITSLQEDSAKISSIVSVIKDIADQTNLLALNAAIEAARAGEHGRGFAVVADEVRKLSERTAHSTNEITNMVAAIQQSTGEVVSEVSNSVNLANASVADARTAGEAVSGIRQMAQQIAGIVTELSAALQQQSTASTEVAQRIESIVNHAQDVTQTAKRTTSTANTMEQVARDMDQLVSRFQV